MPSAGRLIPLFGTAALLPITITSPTSGATITDASPTMTWSFTGTQQSFRLRIWSDISQTTLIYDSGTVASATKSHTVPEGNLLSGMTYYVYVNAETTDADIAESELVSFNTSFAPSVDVTGVSVLEIGDDCKHPTDQPRSLPGVRVSWAQVVPGAGETFVRYSVWRRRRYSPAHPDAGTEAWERITSITTVATTSYFDFACEPHVTFEYAVTWTATAVSGSLVSSRQTTPPTARLEFEWIFMHDVLDTGRFLAIYPEQTNVVSEPDMNLQRVWGRAAPTAFVGEADAHRITIEPSADVHRGNLWRDLRGLQRRHGSASSTLCIRIGHSAERYFGVIAPGASRRDGMLSYVATFEVAEVHYDETVA